MGLFTIAIAPVGGEGHPGMGWRAGNLLGAADLQSKPFAVLAPGGDRCAIQSCLLDGQGGTQQIVDQAEHIGTVARAHQTLSVRCGDTSVVEAAALAQGASTAAGTKRVHRLTTSTCQSVPGWPKTWHSASPVPVCTRANHR